MDKTIQTNELKIVSLEDELKELAAKNQKQSKEIKFLRKEREERTT